MFSVNVRTKTPNKKGESLIYVNIHYYNNRFAYSTGEKIDRKDWDFEKQRTKKSYSDSTGLNKYLNDLVSKIQETFNDYKRKGIIPTVDQFKESLEKDNQTNPQPQTNFFQDFDNWLDEVSPKVGATTQRAYKQFITHLKAWSKSTRNPITYESFNESFYNRFFLKYLIEKKKMKNNTVSKHIGTMKTFLNYATRNGMNENRSFEGFQRMNVLTDAIYLTEVELGILFNKDLSNNPKLNRVRDLFLIGCFTGLRFSDFTQIQPENIKQTADGRRYIALNQKKTGGKVVIPLKWEVLQILDRNGGNPPKGISNQKMNEYLKDLGQLVEFNDNELVIEKRGKKQTETTKARWDMISTHTARRTFATNAFLNGIPSRQIMKITGHTTEKNFNRYIRISALDNALKLMDNPYFNQQKPEQPTEKEHNISPLKAVK